MYKIAVISFHGCPVARLGERDTGGMNVYVLQTAKVLGRLGHQVDIYTRYHDHNDLPITELENNVRIIHLKAGPLGEPKNNLPLHIPQFLSELNSFKASHNLQYDLVHSHYWLSGKVGINLSKEWDIPHVISFHTLAKIKEKALIQEKAPLNRVRGELDIIEQAHAIIGMSDYEKNDLVKLYGASLQKISVIQPGVDLKLFKPIDKNVAKQSLGLGTERIILFVGRIEILKGIDILIEAFASLPDPLKKLLIVGGNSVKDNQITRLKQKAEQLGVINQIDFIGTIPQDQLPIYYNAAELTVVPSYYESFGLVALESMACGTPVIASRVGGLQDIVKHNKTGYLIPWRSPDSFAQQINTLLENKSLHNSMSIESISEASKMGWDKTVRNLLSLYECLLFSLKNNMAMK